MRGIRGAITAEKNTKRAIREAARQLTREMCIANHIQPTDIAALIFTATDDLTAAFPASGARSLVGFEYVPLFDARQMDVEGGLSLCIRALMLVDTDTPREKIHHIYLNHAASLRPDLK